MLLSVDRNLLSSHLGELSDIGAQLNAPQARLLARALDRLNAALIVATPAECLEFATEKMGEAGAVKSESSAEPFKDEAPKGEADTSTAA